jgi:protein SCO1/2
MKRRSLLGTAVAGGLAASAGCLGVLGGGDTTPNVALGEPDTGDLTLAQYRGRRYPVWGERVPEVTLPAVDGSEVAVHEPARPAVLTFYFSNCRTVCPRIVSGLVNLQGHAVANGYADAVSFLPVTFDPARDTPERLRGYGERMGVRSAGDWRWLRPASEARARAVVTDGFGVAYERRYPDDGGYQFVHTGVVLLVNTGGYVERAYQVGAQDPPPVERMVADLRRVRSA